jgi:hypothetical protein
MRNDAPLCSVFRAALLGRSSQGCRTAASTSSQRNGSKLGWVVVDVRIDYSKATRFTKGRQVMYRASCSRQAAHVRRKQKSPVGVEADENLEIARLQLRLEISVKAG